MDKVKLEALLERVEKMDGYDRQLERDLAIDLRDWSGFVQTPSRNVNEKMLGYKGDRFRPKLSFVAWPEPVLSSADAALALVERVLPGRWAEYVYAPMSSRPHWFYISKDAEGQLDRSMYPFKGISKSFALSVLIALLRALIARADG